MSNKTLSQLKKVTYTSTTELVAELLRARIALSLYKNSKTARLQLDFVFPRELIPEVEKELQCEVKVTYCIWSTDQYPHATIFTIKL